MACQRYTVVLMILTYFLPVGSMTFTYARIGMELWGSQSIGECTQRQVENIRSKRRVVKMMIVVVIIFVVCWLPTHIYFIVLSYVPSLNQSTYIQELYLGIYWLAMSSTMYNPIIYFWMNSRFRRGFKQFFSWCPFVHVPPETLSRREAVTSRYSYSGSPEAQCRIMRNAAAVVVWGVMGDSDGGHVPQVHSAVGVVVSDEARADHFPVTL
ncbi:tachykinin-like peptides receptor 99D [Schistocerca americana]|uniref:tachykinin-like peptides receptor 99D n=1 Tax=Schistocerca americana TaxID=7009 RepID=UPI001F4F4B09|nr:tachykinin-like peptides receptor 99D [Schistocerca americana]